MGSSCVLLHFNLGKACSSSPRPMANAKLPAATCWQALPRRAEHTPLVRWTPSKCPRRRVRGASPTERTTTARLSS